MEKKAPPDVSNMHTLKVDNIHFKVSTEELKKEFGRFGEVGDVYIPRDYSTGEPRGFAFVRFLDLRDAEDAMRDLDGRDLLGRECKIQMANRKRPEDPKSFYSSGRAQDRRNSDRRDGGRDRDRSRSRDRDRRSYRRSPSPPPRRDRDRGGRYDSRSRSRSHERRSSRYDERDRRRRDDDDEYDRDNGSNGRNNREERDAKKPLTRAASKSVSRSKSKERQMERRDSEKRSLSKSKSRSASRDVSRSRS